MRLCAQFNIKARLSSAFPGIHRALTPVCILPIELARVLNTRFPRKTFNYEDWN